MDALGQLLTERLTRVPRQAREPRELRERLDEWSDGPFFFRPNRNCRLPGEFCGWHQHDFEHETGPEEGVYRAWIVEPLLAPDGSYRFEDHAWMPELRLLDDVLLYPGAKILVPARTWHAFECIKAGRIYCTILNRDPLTGAVVSQFNGNERGNR